jgi:SAM-dependent methyltransferase
MSSSPLFDLGEEYAEMLQQGLRLSGEDQRYFIEGRLRDLSQHLPRQLEPLKVLDFGCGGGLTSTYLSRLFPNAEILGLDVPARIIDYAQKNFASSKIRFQTVDEFEEDASFDLAYCNGVFHHIPPHQRLAAANLVYRALSPRGCFALFENNPLNPGTRMVMKRIPFDRDAITLKPWETVALLGKAGFDPILPVRSLFYFPASLRFLRFCAPWLASLPLGAQYYAIGLRPAA